MINEIRVAFAHRLKDVIADNCSSLPKLDATLFDVRFSKDLLKVMKLSFLVDEEESKGGAIGELKKKKRKIYEVVG